MHYLFSNCAKLGCWGSILVSNYALMTNEIVLNKMVWNWSIFWVRLLLLCAWNSARVCMSRSGEPGSIRRNMQGLRNLSLLEQFTQARWFGLGRQTISIRRVWLAQTRIRVCLECVGCASRAGGVCCLGESASRSGESLSPKLEFEEHSDGGLTRSPSERWESWTKHDLA